MRTDLDLSPHRVTRFLSTIVALLVVAHLVALLIQAVGLSGRYLPSVLRRVDLDQEFNIPSFFSSVLLLFCALLLFAAGEISRVERTKWVSYWRALALIFAYLAVDEMTELHGFFSELSRVIDTGIFRFAWVLVYGPLVVLLGLIYLRFFLQLPKRIQFGFATAAAVYLSGALGMEIIGGAWSNSAGENNGVYRGITTIEEAMELAGLVVLVHALLSYTQLRVSCGSRTMALRPAAVHTSESPGKRG